MERNNKDQNVRKLYRHNIDYADVGRSSQKTQHNFVNYSEALTSDSQLDDHGHNHIVSQLQERDQRILLLETSLKTLESQYSRSQELLAEAFIKIEGLESDFENEVIKSCQLAMAEQERKMAIQQQLAMDQIGHDVSHMIQGLKEAYTNVLIQAENTIVDIAYAASLKLFGSVYFANKKEYSGYLAAMVKELTAQSGDFDGLRIHLSVKDYTILVQTLYAGGCVATEENNLHALPVTAFVSDETLEPGDCKVFSEQGELDFRLTNRLHALKDALLKASAGKVRLNRV